MTCRTQSPITDTPTNSPTAVSSNPTTVDTRATTSLPGSSRRAAAAVGGAIGGVIVAVLIIAVIILLLLVKFRSQASRRNAFGNAVYGKGTTIL